MEEENNNKDANHVDHVSKYSNELFDKNILFIASGALAVSFAFIKDIIPNFENATHKNFLIGSWYIFSGVIFISLISQFIVTRACDWAYKNADLDSELYNCKLKWWNYPIRTLNFTAILAILIGAILLINFINQNI